MDGPSPNVSDRPRLVVVYGHRSLDVMDIIDGARGWCDVIWLVDPADPSVAAVRPILRKFGLVVDSLGDSPARVAEALSPYAPGGLAIFYDTGMERVAAIARELGVAFHSVEAGRSLEDKLHQREALRAAGLPTPRTVAIPEGADRADVGRAAACVGYPAVLKPRRASGSWHTFPVGDPGTLARLWEEVVADRPEAMLLEEYLPDGPPMPGGFEADYVSVETVVSGGNMAHLAITGRFPLAAPFRETGFFIPATLGPDDASAALSVAGEALRALGFHTGAAHTELKLTPQGPRVIEVNGRIGGGVPDMLRLTTGLDIVKLTMRAALGMPIDVPELPSTRGVGYRFFYQPPGSARRLVSIDGLERLNALPGVDSVFLHYPPGTEIDARDGTRSYVFAVVGWAADYAGVLAVEEFLRTGITVAYA
jgi:biotin carboxylase